MNHHNIKLSVCLVVNNKDIDLIPRCLNSVKNLAQEIIVVHDGPINNQIKELAQKYNAQLIVAPLSGIAEPIRTFSYEAARGEWILQLDADEFLSPELIKQIPDLISNIEVDGYNFIWPIYDGEKYLTKNWPRKTALFRKAKLCFLGIPQFPSLVKGYVKKTNFLLEHQPKYNNLTWKIFKTKWLPWAHLQAEFYFKDFSSIKKFNYLENDWPLIIKLRKKLPLLCLPLDFIFVFIKVILSGLCARITNVVPACRLAWLTACYRSIIDWDVFNYQKRFK